MKRLGSSRRGLSTIVTAGIMLSAVAVLGSAVVTWSNGNLKSYETILSNTAATNTNKINEFLTIENIVFCSNCAGSSSNNVINVTLTNTGTIPVNISKIQINSTAITTFAKGTTLPTIMPKSSYTIAAQLGNKWHSKSVDTITITTARGSIYTTQGVPP